MTVLLKIIKHMTLGLKFLLCLIEKFFNFKKLGQMLRIFNRNTYILVRLWIKAFASQGREKAEIAAHIL